MSGFSPAIEELLRAAAGDPALAADLIADPLAAADRRGFALSGEERAMLAAVGPDGLSAAVAALRARPLPPPPADFPVCTGIRPDLPVPAPQGIRPDRPVLAPAGIRPDAPGRDIWLDEPVRGTRPGRTGRRLLLAAAATTAIAGGGYLAVDRLTDSDAPAARPPTTDAGTAPGERADPADAGPGAPVRAPTDTD
jgi:hypothetical protein